ncbi:MAG: chromate resistance protein [Lautropia sp.]|nr:chromate resistance protein [Lautropia sp.]
MTQWLLLTATLPTSPSALRVRVWRALKATGCGALRDGVYLLPATAPTADALWTIERTIRDGGAEAHVLVVTARDDAQEAGFKALFDRTELYSELLQSLKEARGAIRKSTEAELHKALRDFDQQLRGIQGIDFFPGKVAERAVAAVDMLRREIARLISPGEPTPRPDAIERQPLEAFRGKTWATRQRPWVDQLATAWLVLRFVDPAARFVWLENPRKQPRNMVGFDFDGATFSHVSGKVTFEVVADTFGLLEDPALKRLGDLVHYIDVGGIPVDEAAGIEALVRGLLSQHRTTMRCSERRCRCSTPSMLL